MKSDQCDEYEIWRDKIKWWQLLTKVPKNRQAPHVIFNAIHVKSVYRVIREISHAEAETDEGIDIVLRKLGQHFMPNTFTRRWELWKEFKDLVKTESMFWSDYVQNMKRLRAELASQEMTMSDELFCYAMVTGTKLDTAMRISVERIARNSNTGRKLTVQGVEETILRMKTDDIKEPTIVKRMKK